MISKTGRFQTLSHSRRVELTAVGLREYKKNPYWNLVFSLCTQALPGLVLNAFDKPAHCAIKLVVYSRQTPSWSLWWQSGVLGTVSLFIKRGEKLEIWTDAGFCVRVLLWPAYLTLSMIFVFASKGCCLMGWSFCRTLDVENSVQALKIILNAMLSTWQWERQKICLPFKRAVDRKGSR